MEQLITYFEEKPCDVGIEFLKWLTTFVDTVAEL